MRTPNGLTRSAVVLAAVLSIAAEDECSGRSGSQLADVDSFPDASADVIGPSDAADTFRELPQECPELPTDPSEVGPASALHVGTPPFVVSPPASQQGVAQQVVACPDDEIVVTPPAGTAVGFTSGTSARFGIGWEGTTAPPAGTEARFHVPRNFGLQVVALFQDLDGCDLGEITVDLYGGLGRSYSPLTAVPLALDSPTTIQLHPLTPIFFSLPADRPRNLIVTLSGLAVESGTTIDLGVGPTVNRLPQCHPGVAPLCTAPLQGEPDGLGGYRPIVVEIPPDVEGELFLNEGESVLKALEDYDDCPGVTLSLALAPVAATEDCGAAGDEDNNGAADCEDPACADEPACDEPAVEAVCNDNNDNDGDDLVDCDDPDCADDDACGGCLPAEAVDRFTATLVDTTGLLNNFVCFENTCGEVLAELWDEQQAFDGILYGYSAPFAAPGVVLPAGVDLLIRQYPPADMFAETGSVSCRGDAFFNYAYAAPAPAFAMDPDADDAPLVVFAGLQPIEFGPPVRFPADASCPGGDCDPYLPRFFALDDLCEPEPGVARIRVFNASPRMPSVTVHVTPRPEDTGTPYTLVSGLQWGEASEWFSVPPNVGEAVIAEWSFRNADTTEEFENVLGYFPNVARSAAEVPSDGTCSTIIVAYNELEPEREHTFLVSESPLTCSFWRNRSGDTFVPWPECGS